MEFEALFEPTRLLTYFFIVLRMGGIFFTAPVFSSSALNAAVRMMLTLIVSLVLMPAITPLQVTDPNVLWLVISAAKEILIGVTIGAMTSLLFSSIQLGGYLMDYQMGFSMVSVIDPASNASMSFSGQVYNILAMLIFLAINGHHIFIRAVVQSFSFLPLTDFSLNSESLMFVLKTFVRVFIIAIQITAPVFIALMITNAVMGVMARLVPQMNIMVVGFPIKIFIGIIMLILSLQLFYIVFEKVMYSYFRVILQFFKIAGS